MRSKRKNERPDQKVIQNVEEPGVWATGFATEMMAKTDMTNVTRTAAAQAKRTFLELSSGTLAGSE